MAAPGSPSRSRVLRAPWLMDRFYAFLIPTHQDRDARLAEDLRRIGEVARAGAQVSSRRRS